MTSIEALSIKIFADGADLPGMLDRYRRPYIKGFTTNPTLMRKAGLTDYPAFEHALQKRASESRGRAIRRNLRVAEREARGYWIRAGAAVGLLAIAVQELFEFSCRFRQMRCCSARRRRLR